MKFKKMQLSAPLLRAVDEMGFEEATPIQTKTIPLGLEGNDILGQAQTGTGKTAAFGLPLLEKAKRSNQRVQALVIAPTRELAIQNGQELFRLGQHKKLRVVTVYGGADIRRQIHQLQQPTQIVVGTPGRILDLLQRDVLKVSGVETLVLDEADEMLDMGFIDDIEQIVSALPKERQTLLFSATLPEEIKKLSEHFMTDPVSVKIETQTLTAQTIKQYFTRCRDWEKFDLLCRFVDVHNPRLAIVFARTKRRVAEVSRGLIERGYAADGLHGDLDQYQRSSIMKRFRNGDITILVATDVAARGLDISGVTHIYNYDIPQDPDSYVHRIGRTGRAGRGGMSITFVDHHEMGYLQTIENLTKESLSPLRPPTQNEAFTGQMRQAVNAVGQLVALDEPKKYQKALGYLMDTYTSEDLASALLNALTKDHTQEIKISPDHPLKPKKGYKGKARRGKYTDKKKRHFEKKQTKSAHPSHQKNDHHRRSDEKTTQNTPKKKVPRKDFKIH
ncbi:MAG: DEAD/DEAH box helicase [Aerococcus sp.]|nr:DEAD/DEAH box helicase [Aerococcus sp.]